MKKATDNKVVRFNARYSGLSAEAELVKKDLLKALALVKKLASEAGGLHDWADANCYVKVGKEAKPIPGIKYLDQKMAHLDWLTYAGAGLEKLGKNTMKSAVRVLQHPKF